VCARQAHASPVVKACCFWLLLYLANTCCFGCLSTLQTHITYWFWLLECHANACCFWLLEYLANAYHILLLVAWVSCKRISHIAFGCLSILQTHITYCFWLLECLANACCFWWLECLAMCVCVCVYVHACQGVPFCGLRSSPPSFMCRVGQNHIYTVHIRYFWPGNYHIYGHIRCIYTVLADPIHETWIMSFYCCRGKGGKGDTLMPKKGSPVIIKGWERWNKEKCNAVTDARGSLTPLSRTWLQRLVFMVGQKYALVLAKLLIYPHKRSHSCLCVLWKEDVPRRYTPVKKVVYVAAVRLYLVLMLQRLGIRGCKYVNMLEVACKSGNLQLRVCMHMHVQVALLEGHKRK